jgi:hypothetical protein
MRKRLERGERVVRERFGVDPVAKQTLSRELRATGYRKLSARSPSRPGGGCDRGF